MDKTAPDKLRAFHRKLGRRMLRIYYPKIMKNDVVESKIGNESQEIKRRRRKPLGHVARSNAMPAHCLLKEALNVKRGRGRPRTTITETPRTDTKELGCGDWEEVVALKRDKKIWRLMCG